MLYGLPALEQVESNLCYMNYTLPRAGRVQSLLYEPFTQAGRAQSLLYGLPILEQVESNLCYMDYNLPRASRVQSLLYEPFTLYRL